MAVSKQWTRVRTLGRGASGAEVFLAADDASGELFAVKSASAACAAALRREQRLMSGLRSARVVSCIGGHGASDGSYQLFLEFAPGGSLADRVASDAGLEERAVRGYAADVAAGLAYLHGAGMVHGDVKARNVVIGADGRAKLADFGCAREAGGPIIGGTPAFMVPEVARGEEQGPAADVWAVGCMVVEMATGRAPWSGMDGDALAALHRIGYTEAVPEVPEWLSADAKDFLARCLVRQASGRCTAAQLLEHPFLAAAVVEAKPQAVESKSKWVTKEHAGRGILGVGVGHRGGGARAVARRGREEDQGIGLPCLGAPGLGVRRGMDRCARRANRSTRRSGRGDDRPGRRRDHK